jgi:hypothetical protein
MSRFPLFYDIAITQKSRQSYLNRVLTFIRPNTHDPIDAARKDFESFGKKLLVDMRNHIYSDLSIIDNKTNSLMQLNAILVAVYSIAYLNLIEGKLQPTPGEVGALMLSVVLCLFAILLLMTCVFIRWETYRSVSADMEKNLLWWVKLRDSRTLRYRLAWSANFISILIFVTLILTNYNKIITIGVRQ